MVAGLGNRDQVKSTNNIMTNLMINLKRMGALGYLLVPKNKESDDLLFQAENRFNWNMLQRSRLNPDPIAPGVENESMLDKHSNNNSVLIFEINSAGKKLLVPLKWQKCMPLLIAEFTMIWYLFMDVPSEHSAGKLKKKNS